jgi:hypothetical protein
MTPAWPNNVSNSPVASVEAAILVPLLANSTAPRKRSRCASRRLTMVASTLPCFSRRFIAARDDAVSAVSLPE